MFALLDSSARSTNSSLNVTWERSTNVQARITHKQAFEPSMLDKLAAPTVFMQQGLVYPAGLSWNLMRESIQLVIDNSPIFGARLSQQDGQLQLFNHAQSGITLLQGIMPNLTLQQLLPGIPAVDGNSSTDATVATTTGSTCAVELPPSTAVPQPSLQQQQRQQQQLLILADLPDTLFGHLPGALTPDYIDCPDLALVHVAVVQLAGGGSVFGLRMSHLLGDWGSARLLLRSLAAAYSHIAEQQRQQQISHGDNTSEPDVLGSQIAKNASACKDSRSITATDIPEYSTCERGLHLPAIAPAAPLLNSLVLECRRQLPESYSPVLLKPLEPADQELFTKLAQLSTCCSDGTELEKAGGAGSGSKSEQAGGAGSGSDGQPQRLSYHVLPSRIQQLKDEAVTSRAADVGGGSNDTSPTAAGKILTSHNVLLARVLKAFCSLPGRGDLPHDIAISVDMRGKVAATHLNLIAQHHPPQVQEHVEGQTHQQDLQQGVCKHLEAVVGNFFGTAIVADCLAEKLSLGQLAQQVHSAINRACRIWLPDLAWASTALGISAAELAGQDSSSPQQLLQRQPNQQQEFGQQQQGVNNTSTKQQVTWQRLHAMGPRRLLQRQMALGLLASISTTQWRLKYAVDASMAGQLPVLAVPGFSQPQPYPLVIMQPAPDAMGGGVLVHMFLDGCEIPRLQQVLDALGGL